MFPSEIGRTRVWHTLCFLLAGTEGERAALPITRLAFGLMSAGLYRVANKL